MSVSVFPEIQDSKGIINRTFYLYKIVKDGNTDNHHYVMIDGRYLEDWEGYIFCGEVTGELTYQVSDELSLEKEALEEQLKALEEEQDKFNAEATAVQTVIKSRIQTLTKIGYKPEAEEE